MVRDGSKVEDFWLTEIEENKLPDYITGWSAATCGGAFPYVPPTGWKIETCETAPFASHGACSYCAVCKVKIVPDAPTIVVVPPPTPECEPIAGKPWECKGEGNFDRYDCIDGKITFVEHNSTACGYQEPEPAMETISDPVSPAPTVETFVAEPPSPETNLTAILVALGFTLVGAFILFKDKDKRER